MKLSELRALLDSLDDGEDRQVCIGVELGQTVEGSYAELRDVDDRIVIQVRHSNYGTPVGFPRLTDEERLGGRFKFLDGLQDEHRIEKWATRRYTHIHGDHRIYHDHGGANDTCYGTAFDPHIVAELASEGFVRLSQANYRIICDITEAGQAHLAKLKESQTMPL